MSIANTLLLLMLIVMISSHADAETKSNSHQRAGIKGSDDRIKVNGAHPPWQAIGRVHKAGQSYCTGVLITPNHVLTAAHCIWNTKTQQPIPPKYLHFVAGYHLEKYLAERAIKHVVHGNYQSRQGSQLKVKNLVQDWAILVLEQPINTIAPIPLSTLRLQKLRSLTKENIIQAGFSRDRPYILTVHEQCRLIGQFQNKALLKHNCDAIKGDSGSPLLLKIKGTLHVIAIHSATQFLANNKTVGLAVPSSSIRIQK